MSKLAEERYLVVATDTAHRHVEAWLRRHLPQQPPLPGTAGLQVRGIPPIPPSLPTDGHRLLLAFDTT